MLVTKQAPDFTGSAFYQGKIKKVSLSDYRGKWVVVCFYPGDFTFV
ncbi:redoxin domain-containing protein [Alkalibacter sp. M17DMB]|nr:redoxin domain-containing protein [Alkalibacter mobilis]